MDKNIDYSKYHKNSGLSTKHWGPSGWYFMFSCIMGAYPIKIENNNPEHLEIKKNFKNMISSLRYTMPCIFCRNSFSGFYKELPIENFLCGRIQLMLWLYLIRDRVNQKLILQESDRFESEKKTIDKRLQLGKISKTEYKNEIKKLRKRICITKPSPAFKEILDKFESIRAKCSKRLKTCKKNE